MLTVLRALEYPMVDALGWALLHFLWQALVISGLLAVLLIPLRHATARVRYLALCSALGLMAVCPIGTWIWTLKSMQSAHSPRMTETAVGPTDSKISSSKLSDSRLVIRPTEIPMVLDQNLDQPSEFEPANAAVSQQIGGQFAISAPSRVEHPTIGSRLQNLSERALPWFVCLWMCGVVLLSLRLLVGWRAVLRIKRLAVIPASQLWQDRLVRLAARLRMTQPIRLVESALVTVPTVIGWLRPMILLPTSIMTGLDPSQLEALLAHELAHIRRHDFLINLIQTAIETLLFYHPAVWWVSRRIRDERENCCDDLAVEVCGNNVSYARALATLEELRSSPNLTMAADGGSLLSRIRRLVCPPSDTYRTPWGTSVVAVTTIFAMCLVVYISSRSEAATDGFVTAETPTNPFQETLDGNQPTSDVKSQRTLAQVEQEKPAGDKSVELTPASIADRIEAMMKKYDLVEYSAETSEVRDANGFQPMKDPLMIAGPGTFLFRSDATRWFADESGFTISLGQQESFPVHTQSGFDGEKYFAINEHGVTVGENHLTPERLAPREVFWKGARTSGWLLHALRHFTARVVGQKAIDGHACLVIESEPGKPKPGEALEPGFQPTLWHFEIALCPNKSWLPVQTRIKLNGKPYSTETLAKLAQTPQGDWYPEHIRFVNWQRGDTLVSRDVRVTSFNSVPKFEDRDFRKIDPLPFGTDIKNYRSGRTWHNDVWWPELSKWLGDRMDWPRPSLLALTSLQSFADASFDGKPAPSIQAAEWVAGANLPPANIAPANPVERNSDTYWKWPQRKVTVLFFFGGGAISPTPGWIAGLKALHERYSELGLDVVGVASPTTDRAVIQRTVKSLDIAFPVAIDTAVGPENTSGNPYGLTYRGFGLRNYGGVVVIDSKGLIKQISESAAEQNYSPLEAVVRKQLEQLNPVALRHSDRRIVARRLAFDVTGRGVTESELATVVDDLRSDWAVHFANRLLDQAGTEQKQWMSQHRLTLAAILEDVLNNPASLSSASYYRVSDEWQRQRAALPGKVDVAVEILLAEGLSDRFMIVDPTRESMVRSQVHVKAVPQLRLLSRNAPGGWLLIEDRKSTIEADTNSDGRGVLKGLRKGIYEVTITAPGMATVQTILTIPAFDSRIGIGMSIHQGSAITGTITDSQGRAIVNAKIVPKLRHPHPATPRKTTTEHLPTEHVSTDEQGKFALQNLYDGAYTLEVSAEGYQPQTVELIPAGKSAQLIELLKVGEQPRAKAANKQKVRATFLGGKKKIPLSAIKVTVRRDLDQEEARRAQATTALVTEVDTNADGVAEFDSIPGRLLISVAASRELPYLHPFSHRWAVVLTSNSDKKSPDEFTFTLEDACELTFRAVDVDTGKGIPGVKFGTENAAGEYWLEVVVPECLGANRPVRTFENNFPIETQEHEYESDADGNYRILTGPRRGWKYMLYSLPKDYESADEQHEFEILTPAGGRVSHTFKLRRKKGDAPVPANPASEVSRNSNRIPSEKKAEEEASPLKNPPLEIPAELDVESAVETNSVPPFGPGPNTKDPDKTLRVTGTGEKDVNPPAKSEQKHPPVEFRFEVTERDPMDNTVGWFSVAKQSPRVPIEEQKLNLRITRQVNGVWQALLWNTAEHALLWDGSWSIDKCDVVADPNGPKDRFSIELKLNEAGGIAFRKLTKGHRNQRLAIVIDGEIIVAPFVRDEIGAQLAITGNFTKADAERLAAIIRKAKKPGIPQQGAEATPRAEKTETKVGEILRKVLTQPIEHIEKFQPVLRAEVPARTPVFASEVSPTPPPRLRPPQPIAKLVPFGSDYDLNAVDKPLDTVLLELATAHGLQLEFDQTALDELKVDKTTPCNLVISGANASDVLKLLLEPHQLGYHRNANMLYITSRARIEKWLETRVFQVGSAGLAVPARQPLATIGAKEFASLFQETVRPESWDISGSAVNRPRISLVEAGHSLSIKQTIAGHNQWFQVVSELHAGGRSAETQRLFKALMKRITIEFQGNQLDDVMQQTSKALGVNIVFTSIDNVKGPPQVTLKVQDQPAHQVLHKILVPLNLTYYVDDEVVRIVPASEKLLHCVPHVYNVMGDPQSFVQLIQQNLAPDTWQKQNGPGRVRQVGKSSLLVVYQDEVVHTAIGELLQDMVADQPPATPNEPESRIPVGNVNPPEGEEIREHDVEAASKTAIERGIAFLKSQQRDDGSWPDPEAQPGSVTALATAALLQAGVKPEDPVIQKALPILRKNQLKYVYTVALQTIVFCLASPKADAELIRKHIAWIERSQVIEGPATGGWSYFEHSGNRGDGSCTRFAVLGLHAAQTAGFEIQPKTWERVSQYWLNSQKETGLWGYVPGSPATPSMTLAGIASLATANQYLPVDDRATLRVAAIRKGITSVEAGIPDLHKSGFPFYALHCLERAGHLTRTERFGDREWKSALMRLITTGQQANGAWKVQAGGFGGSPTENEWIASSFALMILGGK